MWSRGTGSAVPSRVSLLISIFRLNLVLTYGIPPKFRGDVHLFIKTAMRHRVSPELSGRAIAYRWRSLPRVRRHRDNSKRVLPWQVTMDHLICASLSHTHCWHEVGMLKVPACEYPILSKTYYFCLSLIGRWASTRLVTNPTYCNVAILPVAGFSPYDFKRDANSAFLQLVDHND